MWEWLDNLDSGDSFDLGNWGVDATSSSSAARDPFENAIPEDGQFQGAQNQQEFKDRGGFNESDLETFGLTALKNALLGNLSLKDALAFAKGLGLGGSGSSTTGGGILDGILNDPLGAAFNATPFLLALNEANKQSGDLNNVLNSVNADSYRRAVLNPYDQDTATGRASLQSDLGVRGVSGSSFGNQALNNYDYTRALGRGDLASKAAVATAQLQGGLINARNTNRNLLLGAGLNASANLFRPQQDPFNLKALLSLA